MEDFLIDVPSPIQSVEPIFGLCFHPTRDLLAYGTGDGTVRLVQYVPNSPHQTLSVFKHHVKSCRALSFANSGAVLYSCSKDRSIVGIDIETGKTIWEKSKAHLKAISAMKIEDNLICTGDENGVIKIWDTRKSDKVKEIDECIDYISAIEIDSDRRTLLATSCETLSVLDYRSGRFIDQSIEQSDELLSLAVMKNGRKVVCGGQGGSLTFFDWDQWSDHSSMFTGGHSDSVDSIIKVDESTILTGSGDGIIRIVNVLPNKLVGVVSSSAQSRHPNNLTKGQAGYGSLARVETGESDYLGFPISSMVLCRQQRYLAACIDTTICFWNVGMLFEDEDDDEDEENEDESEDLSNSVNDSSQSSKQRSSGSNKKQKGNAERSSEEEEDMVEHHNGEDDDDLMDNEDYNLDDQDQVDGELIEDEEFQEDDDEVLDDETLAQYLTPSSSEDSSDDDSDMSLSHMDSNSEDEEDSSNGKKSVSDSKSSKSRTMDSHDSKSSNKTQDSHTKSEFGKKPKTGDSQNSSKGPTFLTSFKHSSEAFLAKSSEPAPVKSKFVPKPINTGDSEPSHAGKKNNPNRPKNFFGDL